MAANASASPCPPLPVTADPLPFDDLISSFAAAAITPAAPDLEGLPVRSSPLAQLPDEILLNILGVLALMDVGDYFRLALVCRRLAHLVVAEEQIWRSVCESDEFGFTAMHFRWHRPAPWNIQARWEDGEADCQHQRRLEGLKFTRAPVAQPGGGQWNGSWLAMFRKRPRIRFHGCYISTSSYLRSGLPGISMDAGRTRGPNSGSSSFPWANVVHEVVYYRYLRFFRDGSVISLLTVREPAEMVRHLSHSLPDQESFRNVGLLMRGRWRMVPPEGVTVDPDDPAEGEQQVSAAATNPEGEASSPLRDGDLVIETEGVDRRFMNRMDLSIRSTRGSCQRATSNKLTWRSYHSFNLQTEDWAEFLLRNERPFFFSRVKSYGIYGE